MRWFVRAWREGKMGEWTLDELVPYRPVEVLLPHEVDNMRLGGETVDLPVAGVPERQMSQGELDTHVNQTVTAYLSTLSSSTSLENPASVSQQRKISKSQRLQEKDAKLRGKGINMMISGTVQRVWKPEIWMVTWKIWMRNSTVSSTIVSATASTSASPHKQSSAAPSSNDPSASSATALT